MIRPYLCTASELNEQANEVFQEALSCHQSLRSSVHTIGGATVLDAGIGSLEKPGAVGSLRAGVMLAELCLGGLAEVQLVPASDDMVVDQAVMVSVDQPVEACLGGQYAGWPLSVGDYFAMASGPMRVLRGREEMLEHLQLTTTNQQPEVAVGVLETDQLPSEEVIAEIAKQCEVASDQVRLAIAPSTSIAGSVQVVARSVETALHKLHALDFDVRQVISATGIAPLSPPAKPGDTIDGIGRTNDAMLYGAKVTLWVDAPDDKVEAVANKVPSFSSSDYGKPFAEIFQQYDYDFYKVDPMLFSPAVVTLHSLQSGRTWRAGKLASDVLRKSFGMEC
ncbi:methenyltetrahydromethanopterin cyclohydrolase [Neorhodopirellula lusitana]|uniref:Methenyltetrahydromethanopterin cyclohydrolase n=1 Tax=Neorhodopirellula lusitana TaxID=445327 RepID=A0ABY1PPS4_9BACT|nr:methenyltetrahydromethanopterin cyclohydrolase [Neorhodopirellula lusitana]